MRPPCPSDGAGFTLFEVLVALAIIAIALLASLRAAGQGTVNLAELRSHTFAQWIAQNVLAEQRARGDWPSTGVLQGTASQGGLEFGWREEIIGTPNPAFRRVDIFVFVRAEPSRTLAKMTGFLANAPQGTSR